LPPGGCIKAGSGLDQHKRFVETARELGCDEDEAAFDEKLRRIASVKPATTKAATGKADREGEAAQGALAKDET
jgi:hypothetical protein